MIAQWQIDQFHQQGFLVVEEVLSSADIAALQSDFDGWVEESRRHATAWGETLDGRPRFDIERDHAPDHPSLRRVASPTEISEGLSPYCAEFADGYHRRAVDRRQRHPLSSQQN